MDVTHPCDISKKTDLFYRSVTADQLFPQVGNVVIVFLHVLLEVVPSESQQWLFHFTVELSDGDVVKNTEISSLILNMYNK